MPTSVFGTLKVYTDPYTTKVFIDGEPGGTTSGDTTVKGILPGTYTLKVTRDDYKEWTKQVTITEGQTTTVEAILVRLP